MISLKSGLPAPVFPSVPLFLGDFCQGLQVPVWQGHIVPSVGQEHLGTLFQPHFFTGFLSTTRLLPFRSQVNCYVMLKPPLELGSMNLSAFLFIVPSIGPEIRITPLFYQYIHVFI